MDVSLNVLAIRSKEGNIGQIGRFPDCRVEN